MIYELIGHTGGQEEYVADETGGPVIVVGAQLLYEVSEDAVLRDERGPVEQPLPASVTVTVVAAT